MAPTILYRVTHEHNPNPEWPVVAAWNEHYFQTKRAALRYAKGLPNAIVARGLPSIGWTPVEA